MISLEIEYLLAKVPERMRKLSKPLCAAIAILLVGFVGFTDYITGNELSFSIFYLIPISLVTLLAGAVWGFVTSLLSAVVWFLADSAGGQTYSHRLIPFWNASIRLGYFLLHTTLLACLLVLIKRTKEMALRDPLTGASNWRSFEELAQHELYKAKRSRKPLTLAYTDLDDFKKVNDTLGHETGNHLLRTTVETVQRNIRPADLLARIGGDEFVLLFPETGYEAANLALNRVRDALAAAMQNNNWPVTISMGAVTFTEMPASIDTLLKQADRLMYQVKQSGRDALRHEQWPASAAISQSH